MAHNIIEIKSGVPRMPAYRMKSPVTLSIPNDEPLAIVGPNGGGKTMLADILTGSHPLLINPPTYDFSPSDSNNVSDNIKVVNFRDAYGSATGDFYQLRWNHGLQQNSLTVREKLALAVNGGEAPREEIFDTLGIKPLLDKQLIMLSSGELRKVQLAEALQTSPRLLILDNPYIGLDAKARQQTSEFLAKISASGHTMIIVVVSREKDIPVFIHKVIRVKGMNVGHITDKNTYLAQLHEEESNGNFRLSAANRDAILSLNSTSSVPVGSPIVECNNISVGYGNRRILQNFSWTVNSGEHWALNGENGAGKSTLLSLVCADNPQAYACDIALFGCKRGSGESIWDIKKRIGYISPEMYRAFRKNCPVLNIAASGLSGTGVLPAHISEADRQKTLFWLDMFGVKHLAERNYLQLSSGEQRVVLLARAFVKDPELLVLDEPFHGLDNAYRSRARDIISAFCSRAGKTLIMVTHYEDEYPSVIDHSLTLKKL